VIFGEPIFIAKGADIAAEEVNLKIVMNELLHTIQSRYPDDPRGQWWGPARLGGAAPTLAQVEKERLEHLAEIEREKEQKNG
jgi:hypothetical protein